MRAKSVTVTGAGVPLGPDDSIVSGIASQSRGGSGAAGDVTITAGSLQVLDGAKVSTQTAGPGNGGNLNIQAGSVLVSGINGPLDAHFKSLAGADDGGARAAIIASSERILLGDKATGNAGQVRIAAGDVEVNSGGLISSRTNTPGRGGNIEVIADRVTLAGGALVSADSSTSANAGRAGDISINARDTVQIGGSSITTTADRAEGGAITIAGNQVQLIDGAIVSAKSSGAGNAGNVTIIAGDTLLGRSSTVSTEATLADGGNIMLIAPTMVHLVDSKITTSVGTGQGKGGNITIDPQFVILNRSQIRADAFGGPGGSITISADVFLTQESVLSASSALSAPGTIDIQARITDISGNVVRLPESVPITAALLRASCAARLAGGSISSLVVAGREGLPPDPEGVLPSPLLAERTSVAAVSHRRADLSHGRAAEVLAAFGGSPVFGIQLALTCRARRAHWCAVGVMAFGLWGSLADAQIQSPFRDPTGRSGEQPPIQREELRPAPPLVPILPPLSPPAPREFELIPSARVFLREIRVVGSTVFSPEEIAAVTGPYTNRTVTHEDLEALRLALTLLYVNKGYVNSGAILPDQKVADGVVTLSDHRRARDGHRGGR